MNTEAGQPTVASSRFKITKEGIESEQRVPGEHTPRLLSSAVLTICAVLAVVAPAVTLKVATSSITTTWTVIIILIQEAVILSVAIIAWARKR
jgi:hypothetical protein